MTALSIELLTQAARFILPVVAVATVIWTIYYTSRHPEALLYLTIMSFPFLVGINLTQITQIYFSFTPSKFFGLIAFVITFIVAKASNETLFRAKPQIILLITMTTMLLISFLTHGSKNSAWFFRAISNIMFLIIMDYWLVNEKIVRRSKLALIVSILLSIVYAKAFGLWPKFTPNDLDSGRFIGTYLNPNRAAEFFIVAIGYAMALMIVAQRDGKKSGLLLFPALGALTWVLLMTGSRGGFFASLVLMAGLLVVALLSKVSRGWLIPVVIAVVAVSVLNAPQVFRSRIQEYTLAEERTDVSERSLGHRWHQYRLAYKLFRDSPILGIGPSNFISEYHRRFLVGMPVHNFYLEVLMDGGLVALLAYLALLALSLGDLLFVARRTKDPLLRVHAMSDGVILVVLLFFGLGSTGATEKVVVMAVGLSMAYRRILESESSQDTGRSDEEREPPISIRETNLASFKNLIRPGDSRPGLQR